MRAIVTGATGFIGKALCRELLEAGHRVFAVVNPASRRKEALDDLVAYAGAGAKDGEGPSLVILEAALGEMERLVSDHKLQGDCFYHLAWKGSGGDARNDFNIQQENVAFTADALRAAADCGCGRFLGAGSQAEYGVIRGRAAEDETVPKPFMMYGGAKLAAYNMGRLLAEQLGISFLWPRIYSVYGRGENSGTLVSYLLEALAQGEVPQLSPCDNMWNFMDIADCARALRVLGESGAAEGVYHVASEDTRPLRSFVEEIRDIASPGAELAFGVKESLPEKTYWLEPDTSKLKALGFRCRVSFAEGIRKRLQEGH